MAGKLELKGFKPVRLSVLDDSWYIFISTVDSNSGVFFRHLNVALF